MRRCPAQRPRGGDVPGSSPALSKAWTEVRSQNCLLHPEGCAFFFFGSIISDSTVHFPGKAPPEPDCASSQRRRARREQPAGVSKRLGTKRKKKKHTPFFSPSVFVSQQRHRLHFIWQRTQESTLTREQVEPSPPAAFLWLTTQRPSRGESFGIILSNKSPPWEPREDWKY